VKRNTLTLFIYKGGKVGEPGETPVDLDIEQLKRYISNIKANIQNSPIYQDILRIYKS